MRRDEEKIEVEKRKKKKKSQEKSQEKKRQKDSVKAAVKAATARAGRGNQAATSDLDAASSSDESAHDGSSESSSESEEDESDRRRRPKRTRNERRVRTGDGVGDGDGQGRAPRKRQPRKVTPPRTGGTAPRVNKPPRPLAPQVPSFSSATVQSSTRAAGEAAQTGTDSHDPFEEVPRPSTASVTGNEGGARPSVGNDVSLELPNNDEAHQDDD